MAEDEVTYDKTLVLAGAKPKRVRFRVVNAALEQTTWSAKGVSKVTEKTFDSPDEARGAFAKAVRTKLRADYAVVSESRERGAIVLEAFAPGGGGGAVLDLSPDGRYIATVTITSESMFGAKIEMVEVATGARHVVVEEPGGTRQNFMHNVLFDRDSKAIYYLHNEKTMRVDIASGERTEIAHAEKANPFCVQPCFDRERRRLALCDRDGILRVLEDGKCLLEVHSKSPTTECRAMSISPSGRLLAVNIVSRGIVYSHDDAKHDTTNEVQIWDVEAGVLWETVTVAQQVDDVGFTAGDDALLVTWLYALGPVALEIPTGRELWRHVDRWQGDNTRSHGWAYSPDGKLLAITGDRLALLDAQTRQPVADFTELVGSHCPMFSRDGRLLATSAGGTALVYAI
jgi:hypothetical protein